MSLDVSSLLERRRDEAADASDFKLRNKRQRTRSNEVAAREAPARDTERNDQRFNTALDEHRPPRPTQKTRDPASEAPDGTEPLIVHPDQSQEDEADQRLLAALDALLGQNLGLPQDGLTETGSPLDAVLAALPLAPDPSLMDETLGDAVLMTTQQTTLTSTPGAEDGSEETLTTPVLVPTQAETDTEQADGDDALDPTLQAVGQLASSIRNSVRNGETDTATDTENASRASTDEAGDLLLSISERSQKTVISALEPQSLQGGAFAQPEEGDDALLLMGDGRPGQSGFGPLLGAGDNDSGLHPLPAAAKANALTAPAPAAPMPVPQAPEPPTPVDQRIAAQVSRAVVAQLPDGDRVLQLRLTPPELGTVRIEIVEHRGQLNIRVSAEDDGVRQSLERALPSLRQDLRLADAPISQLSLTDSPFFNLHQHGQDTSQGQKRRQEEGSRFSLDGDMVFEHEAPMAAQALGGIATADTVDARA